MRKVVGVDPATKELGIAVIKTYKTKNTIDLVDVKQISADEKLPLNDRLRYIYEEVSKVFKEHNPSVIGIESQFVKFNPNAMRIIAYSVGVVWACAFEYTSAQVYILESSRWRSLALDKGNASKKDAVKQMASLFNLKQKDLTDDMAEALGIAVATSKLGEGR